MKVKNSAFKFRKGMHQAGERCESLIRETVDALVDNAVLLLFLALKQQNYELNIKGAVDRWAFADTCVIKNDIDLGCQRYLTNLVRTKRQLMNKVTCCFPVLTVRDSLVSFLLALNE